MKRMGLVLVLGAALLGAAAVALAGSPKKGGTYVGDINSSPFQMHIDMTVNKTGTKLQHFTYLCGTGRPPTSVFGVLIDRAGRFAFTKKTGSIVVWKMAGHFISPAKAFVSLNSLACGGSKGSTTVTLKP
jgi:hypothetical protein